MTPVDRLVTGPPDISIEEAERRMFGRRVEKLPLVDADRRIRGLITKKDILAARQRPYSSKDARGRLLVGAAIGARGDFLERAAELLGAGADVLLIDIAHAHSEVMRRAVEAVRARFAATSSSCAATSRTAEGAAFLRDLGADAIKVGVGPGRGCRTRLETARACPSSRRSARPGARSRRRCRSSPTAACARTRTCSWRCRRRVGRDAGEHALGHRRGAGADHRGPGVPARSGRSTAG